MEKKSVWERLGIAVLCAVMGGMLTYALIIAYAQELSGNWDLVLAESAVFFLFTYFLQGAE